MASYSRVLAALDQADLLGTKRCVKPQSEKLGHLLVNDKPLTSIALKPESSQDSASGDPGNKPVARKPGSKNQKLSQYSYKTYDSAPVIVYTRDEDEADDIIQAMRGPFGFDMEWRCFYRNGAYNGRRTALIQICDGNIILLVQLSAMKKFPQEVKNVIESRDIIKLGVNIRNDGEKLFRDFGVFAANLVELGGLAYQVDPSFVTTYKRPMVALAKMVEFYEKRLLSKGSVRFSNWEAIPLTEEQREYAANDAHCALMMYNKLKTMSETAEGPLDPEGYTSDLGKEYRAGKLSWNSPSSLPVHKTGDTTSFEAMVAPTPQQLRAYNLWHYRQTELPEICATLRSKENPLKESTVISYVIQALQADSSLPFDKVRLRALVYQELGSWSRHGAWLMEIEKIPPSSG